MANNGTYNDAGVIVLTHELTNQTMNMSWTMLPQVSKAFSHVVPVGVCHNFTQPYIETEYRYPVSGIFI
jgi:hypothetical protein